MKATFRALDADDLGLAGRLIHRAFSTGFRRYGYAEPIPDARAGTALAAAVYAADPGGAIVMRGANGRPLGVAFFQRCADHAFVGPLAIDPDVQGRGYGRQLISEVLEIVGPRSTRLLQDAFNPISFRLYAHAGFDVRDVLALLVTGPGGPHPGPFATTPDAPGGKVESLREIDGRHLDELARLDHEAGGVDRAEILKRVGHRVRGVILEGEDRPRGFVCAFPGPGIWVASPGWGEDGRTLAALLVGLAQRCVRNREAVAVFAPASRADLIGPLLDVGFRISHLVNLMVRGEFAPGAGVHLPVLPVDTALPD